MNFFTVGFILANMQLDLGRWYGMAIKVVGGLFMLGGTAELGGFSGRVLRLRPLAVGLAALSFAACFIQLALGTQGTAGRAFCIASGAVTTAAAAVFFMKLFGILRNEQELCANVPEVGRTAFRYKLMLAAAGLAIAADAVNSFAGKGLLGDISGMVMFVGKCAFYVLLVMTALGFNRLRLSFNEAHPIDDM